MHNTFLDQVTSFLAGRGVEAYLVGGYVRDLLLGRQSNDIDIAVCGDAVALARQMADDLHGHFVLLDAENSIARVVSADGHDYADLSRLRGTLAADLAARDFTFNALALPLGSTNTRDVVDLCGGVSDLRAQRVRAFSEGAFRDDPLRLARAVRFAAQFGWTIEPGTAALVRRDASLLARPSGERVRDEFVKILAAAGAWRNLHLLDDLGLLAVILPELDALRGVRQPAQHFYDVFDHTLAVVDAIEETLIACDVATIGKRPAGPRHLPLPGRVLGAAAAPVRAHLAEVVSADRTRIVTLKLAALFHDIAKPQARTVDEQGETHFYNHPLLALPIVEDVLRRLRFSVREMQIVSVMVANHMRPAQIAAEPDVTKKAIYRYFRDTGAEGVDTLLLSLADHVGARGPKLDPSSWWRHAQFTRLLLEYEQGGAQDVINLPRLITGKEVMKAFDLPPGPRIGELLEDVREAQVAGEVQTRAAALDLVRRRLEEHPPRNP